MRKQRKLRKAELRELANSLLRSAGVTRSVPRSRARRLRTPVLVLVGTGVTAVLILGAGRIILSRFVTTRDEIEADSDKTGAGNVTPIGDADRPTA